MQVKLIEADNNSDKEFENEINTFIKDKDVVDIKYNTSDDWYSALVMYNEVSELEQKIESEETAKEPVDPFKVKSPFPEQI